MQKFTIFKIGDEIFGIGIDRVVEILKIQKYSLFQDFRNSFPVS